VVGKVGNNDNNNNNNKNNNNIMNNNNNMMIIIIIIIIIQRMWNLKCTIIPVIIGATGIVTGSFRKNLEGAPGKHSIVSLQKTAILGTSHIIRKVLQCEAV
jgi:predicted phage tail protein